MEVTPCRAYKKNDQALVELKNGAVVRRLVGYDRFVNQLDRNQGAKSGTS
jgi:small nuclear ribonucleoprotein (snRNP)-like protein